MRTHGVPGWDGTCGLAGVDHDQCLSYLSMIAGKYC